MNKVRRKVRGRRKRTDSDVDLHEVGRRIRELRGKITQEEFARALGISQSQLSKYELGQSAPPLGMLAKLAQEFGKSMDWIVRG